MSVPRGPRGLTSRMPGARIESMSRLRHRAMGVALILVVSLGWSAVAACTDSVPTDDTQMACCLEVHQGCEHAAVECCTSPASPAANQQSASVKPASVKFVPVLHLVRFLNPVSVRFASATRPVGWLNPAPVRPPDTPTYLIDSVFLL